MGVPRKNMGVVISSLLLMLFSRLSSARSDELPEYWSSLMDFKGTISSKFDSNDYLEPPGCDSSFDEQKAMMQAATDDLIEKGWESTDGHLIFTSGHMFGNNPVSEYGILMFHDFPLFQMNNMDAIMWLGCTPPDLEYFSMRSYMFSTATKPFPGRIASELPIFASLGDSANNLRFNSSGGSSSPNNLNKTSALIISANQPSAQALAEALVSNGLPSEAVNYDWMPSDLLEMASKPHTPFDGNLIPQAYQFLFRVSIFHNEQDGKRYTDSAFPIRMFHAPSTVEKELIPTPIQLERGTGTNEDWLKSDLDSLTTATKKYWENKQCAVSRTVNLSPIDIEGILNCIPNNIACGGDNRDAAYLSDYFASYTLQPEGNASFLMVTGVNHNISGKATYANLVVETAPQDMGVFNISCNGRVGVNSNDFEGTASVFAPDLENVNALYAFAVSRNCSKLSSMVLQKENKSVNEEEQVVEDTFGCLEVTDDMVSKKGDPFRVVSRAYLEPGTKTGPSYEELLWPSVTEFVCS